MKTFLVGTYIIFSAVYILYTVLDSGNVLHKRDLAEYDEDVSSNKTSTVAASSTASVVVVSPTATAGTSTSDSATTSASASASSVPLRVLSWNIRSAFMLKKYSSIKTTLETMNDDNVPESDSNIKYYWNYLENSWCARRVALSENVKFYSPDIFAIQEALHFQVLDLKELLTGYEFVGVGRDNNKTAGEFEGIFYKKTTIELVDWDTFWLCDDPFHPCKIKGSSAIRDATLGNFREKSTNSPFTIINTHWDEKSDTARKLAASLIKHRAAYEFSKSEGPVILTGDFNSEAYGSSNGGYQIITGAMDPVPINETFEDMFQSNSSSNFTFVDSYYQTPLKSRLGNFATFTGFKPFFDTSLFTRIDFHMVGGVVKTKATSAKQLSKGVGVSEKGVSVIRYMVPDMFGDIGYHLSDHRCVISDYLLE